MSHIKCQNCTALTDTHTTKLCIPPRSYIWHGTPQAQCSKQYVSAKESLC